MFPSIVAIATAALEPYVRNKNTGNQYEIRTILTLLRRMGLTDTMLDTLDPLFVRIKAHNTRNAPHIAESIQGVRALPVGTELQIQGHRIVSMRNATQNDMDGCTADVILISEAGTEHPLSVCGGTCKKDGAVEKCLKNPSAKGLSATAEDIARIKTRQAQAVREYKEWMTATYGADESTWPSRIQTPVAIQAATDAARIMEERFATLAHEEKVNIFRSLLYIDDISVKPAEYLAVVGKEMEPRFYMFGTPLFSDWSPRIVADGIWLMLYNGDALIGRIQVKFNNGVYHKGKTSALHSSWNFTVDLRDVFQIQPAVLA